MYSAFTWRNTLAEKNVGSIAQIIALYFIELVVTLTCYFLPGSGLGSAIASLAGWGMCTEVRMHSFIKID